MAAVTAASEVAQRAGIENVISVDVGGTSCDVCLIADGVARTTGKGTAEFMAYGGPARPQLEGLFEFTRHQCECGRPVCMLGALSIDFEELSEGVRRALDRFMQDSLAWLAKVLETGREQGEFDFRGQARSKAAAILATIQGSRQLARIHGMETLEATFAQIRTDLGIEM